ncbi:MAG: hypothetical protein ACIALR_11495 [Blastopirellula sp. JB062]
MNERSQPKRLQVKEAVGVSQAARQVDRAAGVIRQVQICGPLSRNGRDYSQALDSAAPSYEGVKVNIDHGFAPGEERSFFAGFGVIRHARRQGDAIYGDLHFLKSHELAELVCERAERFPETFGLSHDADIDGYVDGAGIFQVTKITAVRSVDLVGDPATGRGIFESERNGMKKTMAAWIDALDETNYPARRRVRDALAAIAINDQTALELPLDQPLGDTVESEIQAAFRTLTLAAFDADLPAETIGEIARLHALLRGGDVGDQEPAEPSVGRIGRESYRRRLAAEVTQIARRLDALEREQWAGAVLESAGLPPGSPLKAELCKYRTREEMEAFVDLGPAERSFETLAGETMAVRQSPAQGQARTAGEMLAAWGIGSQ